MNQIAPKVISIKERLNYQKLSPLTLVVLEFHLNIECLINNELKYFLEDPSVLLKEKDFTFDLKLKLLETTDNEEYKEILPLIRKVNEWRNKLVHKLDVDLYQSINDIYKKVISNTNQTLSSEEKLVKIFDVINSRFYEIHQNREEDEWMSGQDLDRFLGN